MTKIPQAGMAREKIKTKLVTELKSQDIWGSVLAPGGCFTQVTPRKFQTLMSLRGPKKKDSLANSWRRFT